MNKWYGILQYTISAYLFSFQISLGTLVILLAPRNKYLSEESSRSCSGKEVSIFPLRFSSLRVPEGWWKDLGRDSFVRQLCFSVREASGQVRRMSGRDVNLLLLISNTFKLINLATLSGTAVILLPERSMISYWSDDFFSPEAHSSIVLSIATLPSICPVRSRVFCSLASLSQLSEV